MGEKGEPGDPGQVLSGGASVYINWGSTVCPGSSAMIYDGIAVSPAFNNAGGGAQYLCVPFFLNTGDLNIIPASPLSSLVGVHLETFADPTAFPLGEVSLEVEPLHNNDGQRVVCSVCLTPNTAVVMTPNNDMCPENNGPVSWDLEYSGFLMAARDFIEFAPVSQGDVIDNDVTNPPHFRTEYVCVNIQESLTDVDSDPGPTTEAEMSHVRIYCSGAIGFNDECLNYFTNVLNDLCRENDGLCAVGPLRCSVCSASFNMVP